MDETSDPHMETDVSSTTEDVPEMQEVTGSSSNVVLIVEKIDEEHEESSPKGDGKPTSVSESSSPSKLQKPESSPPQKAMPLAVSVVTNKSPRAMLQKIVLKRPSKPILTVDQLNNAINSNKKSNQVPQSTDLISEEMVDSSSKVEKQNSPNKNSPEIIIKSPHKDVDVEIILKKTITNVQNVIQKSPEHSLETDPESTTCDSQKTTQSTPVKEQPNFQQALVKTPTKEQVEPQKSPEKSPVKTPMKEQMEPRKSPVKTPMKEQEESQKSPQKGLVKTPTKEHEETQKSPQKTPAKTPIKEQGETQITTHNTPVKEQQEVQKPLKTPTKELSTEPPKTTAKDHAAAEKTVNGSLENSENNKPTDNNNSVPMEIVIEKDNSNDSQLENMETTEKDHNKSISRELKSLIKSAKESKIISECTQLTSKTRKSRTALDSSNPLNTSVEADKIQGNRRISTNSQKSNCSEKSDKTAVKRSMRSQNPEFVNKVKLFLNSVTKTHKDSDDGTDEDVEEVKSKEPPSEVRASTPKKKKLPVVNTPEKPNKLRTDPYCWRCHWAIEQLANEKTHPPMHCTVCPRAFHFKCLSGAERSKINTEKNWVCPECMSILHAESSETRSPAMKKISLGMLCELLKFALQRMMDLNGVDPFMQPVDRTAFPDYDKYVVHPMDLSLMKENIDAGLYGSTEAFVADAQWILHNSIIFNTMQSKLTGAARALVRSCRAEMGEIEACPECYKAAHARRPTWFTDVCTTPHVLLWAKLKGFPYWPAKGMSVNNSGLVDVRFFGAHDRAWVPAKDCFLYSERDPNNFRTKRQDILDSMQEAEQHIRNISRKYGKFVYPPFKTQFDPSKLTEQIKLMIPSFEGEVRSPKTKSQNSSPSLNSTKSRVNSSRSNSKSSKEGHEGDTSEGEDTSTVATRKMADGAEIAREEDDSIDKDKIMDVDIIPTPAKEKEKSRKRRHSQLEEAVITIMDINVKEKKRKIENKEKPDDKTETESTSSKDAEMKTVETKKTESTQQKTENTPKVKEKVSTPTPNSSDKQKPRVAPIKIITTSKGNRTTIRSSTPKIKLVTKSDKRSSTEKNSNKDEKKQKRRNSRNRTLNISNVTAGKDKIEKKTDKSVDSSTKEKVKDTTDNKTKESEGKIVRANENSGNKIRDRVQFDDNTSLAVLARKSKDGENDVSGLPTISSVISLSTTAQNTKTTTSTPTNKTVELMIEANSSSSIFTPTSKENVNNMKDAVDKLQKLRSDTSPQSLVGKVGVRAFARMTSPPMNTGNKDVEVEIKAEPIDLDDSDRQMEKMEVMNAFHLRPVNPPSNLREVRINKVVVGPSSGGVRRGKVVEVRPRAKKSFPQPVVRPEGRSELNGKNSMVYIPIQPAGTPGPPRAPRPPAPASAANMAPVIRHPAPVTSSNSLLKSSPSTMATITSVQSPVVSASSPGQGGPTIGQATVHTVPLFTSVNGQWTLALQPVMSVGGVDTDQPPMVNGTPERLPVSGITTINNLNVGGLATVNNISSIANINNVGSLATISNVGSLANVNSSSSLANVNSVTGNVTGATNITSNVTGTTGVVPIVPVPPAQGTNKSNDTSSNPGEPPRLQQRPVLVNPLDARAPLGPLPVPTVAGPITAKLNQHAVKLADFFRTLLEDSLEHIDEPEAQLTSVKLQLEHMRWRHQQEIDEINHNHELTLAEMRTSFEKERARITADARRAALAELESAVAFAKTKQWCANCSQEAQFYCCWNTSYCDYPCQRAHWAQHFAVCAQKRSQDGNGSADANSSPPERLQPQPGNLPKNTPKLTAASGKARAPQQDSIIMSVMEDARGNQTLKCVGTYKPPATGPSPLHNKQITNNEDNSSKKVVTSGGYLIVGAGVTNSTAVVTQSRRGPTIQYYS